MTKQVSPGIHLITTAPSLTKCRSCNRQMLAATIGGVDRHVDTATMNDVGELAALVEGRATFALVTHDYLVRRTVHHISAGTGQRPVLAEHTCRPTPDHHIDHAWTLAALAMLQSALGARVIADLGDTPPF